MRRLAAECLAKHHPQRWRHVQGVAARAAELGDRSPTDPVLMAAWAHDIGYAPRVAKYGLHALDGAQYLQDLGVAPLVVSLVAFHTGAEFEAQERGLYGELLRFERPPQDLLDRLILCDLTVAPDGRDIDVGSRIAEIGQRYSEEDPVNRAVRRSADYLKSCCARAAAAASAEERSIPVL